jgi:hypothetical protein
MIARLLEEMRTNQAKADTNQEEIQAKMDSHHGKLMTLMKAGKEKIENTGTCLVSKKPTSEEIKSEAKHEEVSMEEATVETFEALKERYRDQHLAVRCHGQPKKRTQGNGGSQKKLVAACKGMTMSFLHGIRDTVVRDKAKTSPCQELRKDGR